MIEFWNENAKKWEDVVSVAGISSRRITNPAILREVLNHSPKTVLDIGCGEGWLCRELEERGLEVVGIDGSERLIELCKEKSNGTYHRFSYQDLQNGLWQNPHKFDLITLNFALLEKDIEALLIKLQDYLHENGRIIIQTLHPCFALEAYKSDWQSEDFKQTGVNFAGEMPWYGRTLGDWVTVFTHSKLVLERFLEPINPEKGSPASAIFVLKSY